MRPPRRIALPLQLRVLEDVMWTKAHDDCDYALRCVCVRVCLCVCVCVCVCNCVVVLCWSLTHNHGVVCASRKNGLLRAPFVEPRRALEEHIYDIGPDWTVTLILILYCPAVGSVQRLAADGTLHAFDGSTRGFLTFAFLAFVRSCINKS